MLFQNFDKDPLAGPLHGRNAEIIDAGLKQFSLLSRKCLPEEKVIYLFSCSGTGLQ